jgi:PAS domain S-box-containing protein
VTISFPSSDEFRLLVDSVVDYAIFMLDPSGHVATWSAGAEKIKGYRGDEIIGKHFSTFYPAADIAAGKPERELEIATEVGRVEDEGWRIRKDGTPFWANVVITALRDESGSLRGFGKVTSDLTDRRRAEEELRSSEQRFHHLVDAVIDYAIYMLDPTGHVSTWNPGASRLKGYAPDEVIGKHFSIFYPPEDRAGGRPEQILDIVRRDGHFEGDGWRVRKDGTRFWANVVITALHDSAGVLLGFAKVTRDLTARREAEDNEKRLLLERTAREVAERSEQKIRESEERLRALSTRLEIVLEGVADAITVQHRAGHLVFANSAAARFCGFETVDELLTATPETVLERFELLDGVGRPVKADDLPGPRALRGEQSASALIQVHHKRTGAHSWALIRAGAVVDSDGTPELAVNIWHDVTQEHRGERDARFVADATTALNSSTDVDELLAAFARVLVPGLADWASVHLLEHDRLRHVTSFHSHPAKRALAEEYQRRFPPDASRPRLWNVVHSGRPELSNEGLDQHLARTVAEPEQLAMLRSIGMNASALAPIMLGSRVLGVISIASAESERRYDASHLELLLELGTRAGVALERAELFRAARDAAQVAEEVSRAKDEFLATVSHELRTPLNAIIGWSTLLKDRVTEPALAKPIQSIHRNAQAQVRIIEDILDVSRVITGKFRIDPKPVDLVDIAREAADVVQPSAVAKSVSLNLDFEHEFCLLVADPARLQQVIWNLLSNAIKFTPSGGAVSLSIRQVASHVVLEVSDTGIGIEPGFLPYIFDRFRQADPSTTRHVGGLGLGLSLVRHIVELHGGTVDAASGGKNRGATFAIELPIRAVSHPLTERRSPQESAATELGSRASLRDARVLVIDDELDAREIIASVLEDAGALVVTAASSAEAMSALGRFAPQVILSDIAMPGEDGIAFIHRLRRSPELKDVPALAFTAYASDGDRMRVLEAGFNGHVAKPIEPQELVRAIVKALASPVTRAER